MFNKFRKTNFASYCVNGIADGCKHCIRGEKLVLFVTGLCSTGCAYCPLSYKRKGVDKVYANERECRTVKDVILEARESNAKGAGITGGDPLLKLDKTLKFAKELKKSFGKDFHIHIYLSTKLVDEDKLRKLSQFVDEVRFHPLFLKDDKLFEFDIGRIKLAKKFFKNVGVEMPIFPDKKKQELDFILKVADYISFVNLNELEIGETNLSHVNRRYKTDKSGYTIKGSVSAGQWILSKLAKQKTKLKIHLCTAETKNWFQFKNRLLKHKIFPYGRRTADGTVLYFVIDAKNFKKMKGIYFDSFKKRFIVDPTLVPKLKESYKIKLVEEFPTFDGLEVEESFV